MLYNNKKYAFNDIDKSTVRPLRPLSYFNTIFFCYLMLLETFET